MVNSHADNLEKQDILRDLVKTIKDKKYEICVLSHINVPCDIVKRIDYFIYDSDIDLDVDRDLSYWTYYTNDLFTIYFKSKHSSIHRYTSYIKIIIGGIMYLKHLGYDIVHSINYDIKIISFEEFKHNKTQLITNTSGYDIIYYKDMYSNNICDIFSVNLNNIKDNIKYDRTKIRELYRQYHEKQISPVAENMMMDIISKKSITKNISDCVKIGNQVHINKPVNSLFTFFIYDDFLYFFFLNKTNKSQRLDIIYDKNAKQYNNVRPHTWKIDKIDELSKINSLKSYIDGKLYEDFNNDTKKIKEWAKVKKMIDIQKR